MKKIFEKKLGAYYLVEFNCDNDYYYIQLYKKWTRGESYEATDYLLKFPYAEENKRLKDNWNKLRKYLHNIDVVVDYSENYDGRFINYDELVNKMQEIKQER